MVVGSVCTGVSADSLAWRPLGWRTAFVAEIAAFPSAVLAHRLPETPNLGDFTAIRDVPEPIDVLMGGTPCQSFSVAGLRAGLHDPRGQLVFGYLRLAQTCKPRWVVWENVPGVLSSRGGRDFGAFLGAMAELGYGWAYRVLDAQHFGVPQRRRRVFVVGHLGDWRRAAAVLFEPESLSGRPSPRGETGKETAKNLRGRANASHREDSDTYITDVACTADLRNITSKANRSAVSPGRPRHTLHADPPVVFGWNASDDGASNGIHPVIPIDLRQASRGEKATNNRTHGSGGPPGIGVGSDGDPAFTVSSRGQAVCMPVVFGWNKSASQSLRVDETAPALQASSCSNPAAMLATGVRRLTPRECERLQGMPDDWTLVPYRGKPAADGPRYTAIGNSIAVPVLRWIGERIRMVETMS